MKRFPALVAFAVWSAIGGAAAAAPPHADHRQSSDEPAVLAPGWGRLAFIPPAPGSYALPPLFAAADGKLLDSQGSATTLHDQFGDEVVLLSFVFASCNDVNGCPLATSVLHRVQQRVARSGLGGNVKLISLSFDPARDSPDVMRRYGESFANRDVEWSFLTAASQDELQPILEAYGQSITREFDERGEATGNFAHILRVFLIDREHRVRNVYTVSFLHPDTLINDIETLLAEDGTPAETPAGLAAVPAAEVRTTPGDDRSGYHESDFRSDSVAISSRRGSAVDLLARVENPPLGLPVLPVPPDNRLTRAKIELGRKLFYDRRLSQNRTISCAMCHVPEQGFTNNEIATSVGIEGRSVRRNAPTLYNVAYHERLFHDGREATLEKQIWGPLLARNEMGNPSAEAVVAMLRALPEYAGLFEAAFPGRGPSKETIEMALASYERTLVSAASDFDRWRFGGESGAISESAKRGFDLFAGRAGCSSCHTIGTDTARFFDGRFHNTGIGFPATEPPEAKRQRIAVGPGRFLDVETALIDRVGNPPSEDFGRFEITANPADRWRYRTPSLRNVALTGPYMHDGSLASLREVVAYYDRGGVPNPGLDPRIRPLGLSIQEVEDLVAFLESLTGNDVDVLVGDAFAAPIGNSR